MAIMMALVLIFVVLGISLFGIWGGLSRIQKKRDRYGREWISEFSNPIPPVLQITGLILKYIGGIGLTIGWIWAIILSITYFLPNSINLFAIGFAVFLGPVFAIVEAFWWGHWIPFGLCWPSFGLYLIGVQLDGGRK